MKKRLWNVEMTFVFTGKTSLENVDGFCSLVPIPNNNETQKAQ